MPMRREVRDRTDLVQRNVLRSSGEKVDAATLRELKNKILDHLNVTAINEWTPEMWKFCNDACKNGYFDGIEANNKNLSSMNSDELKKLVSGLS